ncbi:histidine kinase [Nocardioides nanhaiensis]|uniref:histidine kinase n=1 Tax=Nocardioides nanhaiensis TaxID=1476871 RepID=A0ABP8VRJ7_9ACTN
MGASAALALFMVLGIVMTRRPLEVALPAAVLAVAVGALLAWRGPQDWRLLAGLAVPVVATAVLGHDQSANLVWMTSCVLAAWTALVTGPRLAGAAWGGLVAVLVTQLALDRGESGWFAWIVGTTFTSVACTFARRLRVTNERLTAAQAELAERSRAEERHRIAGEVHDVIGHALTVSLLHIEGARLAVDDDDPADARERLAEAERLTRHSLEEVRATVGLMRADGDTAPLPDARDLPALVESFRRAGARVELHVSGDLAAAGQARGLAVYRILQEALTNATRHAPGEPVQARVEVIGSEVTLEVLSSGAAAAPALEGSGLRGMRERADSLGGLLTAGPVAQGWCVDARIPR